MEDCSFLDNDDLEGDRVVLNVGGVRFETYITTLQNIADTRLAWLTENVEEEALRKKEFFFDRHPGAFVYIMNFYRTGKLHTPRDMCGPAFEEELQFWGIDEKQMEPCCWETFTKHREAEGNLKTFEGPGFEDLNPASRKFSTFAGYEEESCCFKRQMLILWDILNDPHSSELAKRFSLLSCCMIVISLSVYCLTTMDSLKKNVVLTWINRICLVFFTLEFVARVVACPSKVEFIKDYKNWIDLLSITPTFLLIPFADKSWIHNLVIIRLLRVFKFFKLSYGLQVLVHTLKASSYELTLLLLVLLIPLVVFSSLVYAFESTLEQSSTTKFDSIPRTFWWCIITMTTVGYGDITPKTWPGQFIGSICAIIGVLIIALPISVIGNNFTLYYAHVRARLKLPKKNRHLLQGRLRGLLRQPAMLSSRDRDRKTIKRNGSSLFGSHGDRLTVDHSPSPYLQLRRQRTCIRQAASELSINITECEDSSPSADSDQENCDNISLESIYGNKSSNNNNNSSNNGNNMVIFNSSRNNNDNNNDNNNNNNNSNNRSDNSNSDTNDNTSCDTSSKNSRSRKHSKDLNRIDEEKQNSGGIVGDERSFLLQKEQEADQEAQQQQQQHHHHYQQQQQQPSVPPRSRNRCKKSANETNILTNQPPMFPGRDGIMSNSMMTLSTDDSSDCEQRNTQSYFSLDNFNALDEQRLLPNHQQSPPFTPPSSATPPLSTTIASSPSFVTENNSNNNNNSRVPPPPDANWCVLSDEQTEQMSSPGDIRRESMRMITALSHPPPPQPPIRTRSKTAGSYNEALLSRQSSQQKVNYLSNPALGNYLIVSKETPSRMKNNINKTTKNCDGNEKKYTNDGGALKSPLKLGHKIFPQTRKRPLRRSIDSAYGEEARSSSEKTPSAESMDGSRFILSEIGKESGV